ncbi:MAG TPA: ABC transporter permease [Terriglobia bacterium]|nr:ABC transporter permease [Terriglobia bacterium]
MKPERYWNLIRMRLRSLLRRDWVETELEKELTFHLEQEIQSNLAAGMAPADARYAALRRLGGVAQIKEECRDMRRTQYLENVWQDLRFGARMLRKSPGFTAVVVLTLALGIGANSAIFSVIDGVLLKPLPYPDANRIVRLFFSSHEYPKFPLNPFDFRDLRARNRSFQALAAFTRGDAQLSGSGEPVRLLGFRVTAEYFRVLGVAPARGREFNTNDELPGNSRVVILSDRTWRDRFAADPGIVGRKITLDSQPYTVVGVMPPGTEHPGNKYHAVPFGDSVEAWRPFPFKGNPNNRGSHFMEVIGRLKQGVTLPEAQAEMNTLITEIGREHGGYNGWRMLLVPLYSVIVGAAERLLLVLLGTVGLVLLIACANVANLLMARATARQREIAVRVALGAPQSRLVRQTLTESLLISFAGGALGIVLALGGVKALVLLLPAGFPRIGSIHVNGIVLAFTLLISLATGILFGLAPALAAAHTDPQQGLRDGGRGATSGLRHLQLRNVLVVAEVCLATLLLVGAGLMLRSFVDLLRENPGFKPEHMLTASLSLPTTAYKTAAAVSAFCDRLTTNLAAVPGIKYAGIGTDLPWTGYDENASGFTIKGKTPPPGEGFHARYHTASPDYFRALGIPLLRGRFFTKADKQGAPQVMIINSTMARLYWPKEGALGARLAFTDTPKEKDWITVVGIVGDVKDTPGSSGAEPAFWWPALQVPFVVNGGTMSVAIRSDSNASQLANVLRSEVRRLDPTLAVADLRLMDQITDANVATARFAFFLVGLFAAFAIILAGIGIYGVMSYSVNQRTHEFGLRVALGAQRRDVLRLVISQGAKLTLVGAVVGVTGALALSRVLKHLIYGVSAADPLTFAAVFVAVVVIGLSACYVPARRATAADPMKALRAE